MTSFDTDISTAHATAGYEGLFSISVRSGIGRGPTKLASFDSALLAASVANFNLLHLTSVIPPASEVHVEEEHRGISPEGGWGDRLYVVMAECRVEVSHEEAWAALGWVQEEATGRGIFVEHIGHSRARVEADIQSSLQAVCDARPGFSPGEFQMAIRGVTCEHEPVCALVIAAYESEPWRTAPVLTLP